MKYLCLIGLHRDRDCHWYEEIRFHTTPVWMVYGKRCAKCGRVKITKFDRP